MIDDFILKILKISYGKNNESIKQQSYLRELKDCTSCAGLCTCGIRPQLFCRYASWQANIMTAILWWSHTKPAGRVGTP